MVRATGGRSLHDTQVIFRNADAKTGAQHFRKVLRLKDDGALLRIVPATQ